MFICTCMCLCVCARVTYVHVCMYTYVHVAQTGNSLSLSLFFFLLSHSLRRKWCLLFLGEMHPAGRRLEATRKRGLILWHRTSSLRWSATAALRKQSGRGWSPAQRAPRRLVTGHPLWVVRHQARAGEGQGPPHTPPRGGSIRDGAPSMGAVTTRLPWGKGRCVVVLSLIHI